MEAGYVPRGRVINIGNLPVYEAPDNVHKRRMLIGVYDVFGFSHSNMMQITDMMALQAGGFRAILPDFFRGESMDLNSPIEYVPPKLKFQFPFKIENYQFQSSRSCRLASTRW